MRFAVGRTDTPVISANHGCDDDEFIGKLHAWPWIYGDAAIVDGTGPADLRSPASPKMASKDVMRLPRNLVDS
jgi:hypothetical protein